MTTEGEAKKEQESEAVAGKVKAVAEMDTTESAPQAHQADANTAAAKEKPVTIRCNEHSRENNSERTKRIQNMSMNNTETTVKRNSDDTIVTGEERPGHRVLTDNVTELRAL